MFSTYGCFVLFFLVDQIKNCSQFPFTSFCEDQQLYKIAPFVYFCRQCMILPVSRTMFQPCHVAGKKNVFLSTTPSTYVKVFVLHACSFCSSTSPTCWIEGFLLQACTDFWKQQQKDTVACFFGALIFQHLSVKYSKLLHTVEYFLLLFKRKEVPNPIIQCK